MDNSMKILGNKIDSFKDYREMYKLVIQNLKIDNIRGYVTVNNVHTMMEGYWNPDYQAIINESYLSIPDGKPLEIVGKLKGNKLISRLFGPSIMEKFIDWGRNDQISHFFLGSSEENLRKLRKVIESKYPGTRIVGMISPPFKPMEQWDNNFLVKEINSAAPDFIWIGLGAPKQERWMYANFKDINKGVLFGIGAGFDYLTGNTKHAPTWMKNASLEWAFRLFQEPKRLWKRYLKTIPPFILLSTLELVGFKVKKTQKNNP